MSSLVKCRPMSKLVFGTFKGGEWFCPEHSTGGEPADFDELLLHRGDFRLCCHTCNQDRDLEDYLLLEHSWLAHSQPELPTDPIERARAHIADCVHSLRLCDIIATADHPGDPDELIDGLWAQGRDIDPRSDIIHEAIQAGATPAQLDEMLEPYIGIAGVEALVWLVLKDLDSRRYPQPIQAWMARFPQAEDS